MRMTDSACVSDPPPPLHTFFSFFFYFVFFPTLYIISSFEDLFHPRK